VGGDPPTQLSEQETLTLAIRYEAAYIENPLETYRELTTLYGRENTGSIVRWIETTKFNCVIDESAGLDEAFDPKEAA
jgi:hypothetical protein